MIDELLNLLKLLAPLSGISGHEDVVIEFLTHHFSARKATVNVDSLGNVVATYRRGTPHVAILAHMDTVGMKVKRIINDNLLLALPIGGINYKALPGTRVIVGEQNGVVVVRSQHLSKKDDHLMTDQDIWIQVGNTRLTPPTTPIRYLSQPAIMGNLYTDCGLDDRVGCALLCLLADYFANNDVPLSVSLVGTVQEETTCLGAMNILRELQPDYAIFLDGTLSYDLPETRSYGSTALGQGAVIVDHLYVSGLNGWHADPKLNALLVNAAHQSNIPYQQDAVRGLMSDARSATQNGIPSAFIGIPMRGKHSASETIHMQDALGALQILTSILPSIGNTALGKRGLRS